MEAQGDTDHQHEQAMLVCGELRHGHARLIHTRRGEGYVLEEPSS